jgi:transposase
MSAAVDAMQAITAGESGHAIPLLPPLLAANDPTLGGDTVVVDVTVSERTLAATCGNHTQNFPNLPESADRLRQWGLRLASGAPPVFRINSTGEHYAVIAAILHMSGAQVAVTVRAYIGVDVSKDTLDVCWDSPSGEHKYKVTNDPEGIDRLHKWTLKLPVGAVPIFVMESTGSYHTLPAAILRGLDHRLVVSNPTRPLWAKKADNELGKDDPTDAKALSGYGRKYTPREWTAPSDAMTELRAMSVRMMQLVENEVRERSRLEENPRVVCWIGVARSIQRCLKAIAAERKALSAELRAFYKKHSSLRTEYKLLQTIPGVGPTSANHLLCLLKERGLQSPGEAAALLGVVPVNHKSGTSVNGKPHISGEGDARARSAMYMGVVSACHHNAMVKAKYESFLARGLVPKQSRIAIIHWQIRVAFAMLRDGVPFNDGHAPHAGA